MGGAEPSSGAPSDGERWPQSQAAGTVSSLGLPKRQNKDKKRQDERETTVIETEEWHTETTSQLETVRKD